MYTMEKTENVTWSHFILTLIKRLLQGLEQDPGNRRRGVVTTAGPHRDCGYTLGTQPGYILMYPAAPISSIQREAGGSACLCQSAFSRKTIYIGIYDCAVMEVSKPHSLPSASWRTRGAGGIRPENQGPLAEILESKGTRTRRSDV